LIGNKLQVKYKQGVKYENKGLEKADKNQGLHNDI